MSSRPHYFAIGLFILAATGLGLIGLVAISSDVMNSPEYFIETYVDESVQGIDVGTPFKFRGVKVGNISEIAVVSQVYDTRKMYVMIRVALDSPDLMKDRASWERDLERMIDDGLRLKLVPQGITGLSFLEGEYFPDSVNEPLEIDWTPAYTYIPSTPAMLTLLGRSIERITTDINNLDMQAIGADVQSITSNLNLSVQHIEQITREAAGASDRIIQNVALASDNLPGASTNLTESMALILKLANQSDHDLNQILSNMRYITEDTKELVRMLKRYPGMLLSEPPETSLGPRRK